MDLIRAAGGVPPNWQFENSITGDCSNTTYDMGGFYYDGTDDKVKFYTGGGWESLN